MDQTIEDGVGHGGFGNDVVSALDRDLISDECLVLQLHIVSISMAYCGFDLMISSSPGPKPDECCAGSLLEEKLGKEAAYLGRRE